MLREGAAVGENAVEGGATAEGEVAVESELGAADGDGSHQGADAVKNAQRVGDKEVSMPRMFLCFINKCKFATTR